jgi:hypothetical protein
MFLYKCKIERNYFALTHGGIRECGRQQRSTSATLALQTRPVDGGRGVSDVSTHGSPVLVHPECLRNDAP